MVFDEYTTKDLSRITQANKKFVGLVKNAQNMMKSILIILLWSRILRGFHAILQMEAIELNPTPAL